MKLAFIVPTAYLSTLATKGDFYLALAHLIDNEGRNDYAQFHIKEKEKGHTVYLDNGLFEGSQVDPLTLIHRAKVIKADLVCAPDVLFDGKSTIKEFKSFIKLKQEEGLVAKVMGIPQASKDNPSEWWDCFQFFDTNKYCDVIGLSKLSIPHAFGQSITTSRVHLIEQLFGHSYLASKRLTPMHLLGLGESYDDVKQANRLLSREIVSCDSSSCFVHGVCGVPYDSSGIIPGENIKERLDFSITTLRKSQEYLIQHNINVAKEIANG